MCKNNCGECKKAAFEIAEGEVKIDSALICHGVINKGFFFADESSPADDVITRQFESLAARRADNILAVSIKQSTENLKEIMALRRENAELRQRCTELGRAADLALSGFSRLIHLSLSKKGN